MPSSMPISMTLSKSAGDEKTDTVVMRVSVPAASIVTVQRVTGSAKLRDPSSCAKPLSNDSV